MEKQKNAVGRRKEAVTRIFLAKGSGKITVNDRDYKEYFPLVYLQNQVEMPLKAIQSIDKYDVKINADGGGLKGQAEAAICFCQSFTAVHHSGACHLAQLIYLSGCNSNS